MRLLLFLLNFLNVRDFGANINQNKLITVNPGGLSGFYTFGVASYLKNNYNLNNYSYLGASAGAWNSLFLTAKKSNEEIFDDILKQDILDKSDSLANLMTNVGDYIKENYVEDEFELSKLNICVSKLTYSGMRPTIMYNFKTLEEAVDTCILSSYIPFVTGGVGNVIKNNITVDGGFNRFPPKNIDGVVSIHSKMWGRKFNMAEKYQYHQDVNKLHIMFSNGYNDTKEHKDDLDLVFYNKDI